MDKRYHTLSITQQLALRQQAVEDVLAHPECSLAQAVRHLKKTMRMTTSEMAKLSGVAYRTMQDIEQERSAGSVQTMNAIFGMLGLKLSVARTVQSGTGESGGDGRMDKDKTGLRPRKWCKSSNAARREG
jgi:DNA-binding XRE family transcriptional regulator